MTPLIMAVAMGWYIQIQPLPNGPVALIGPWHDRAVAADVDGSMLYYHPFLCHITGPVRGNCRILGNGLAYPANTPYPPEHQIPSSGPIHLPLDGNPRMAPGLYGLYYANDGTPTVFPKRENAKYRALVLSGQGMFPQYHNVNCPNWPFFKVGTRLGQDDGACN